MDQELDDSSLQNDSSIPSPHDDDVVNTPQPTLTPTFQPLAVVRRESGVASANGDGTRSIAKPGQEGASAFNTLKRKTRDPQTVRQTMKKAKISLCNSSETTAECRLIDQRMKTLLSAMDLREKLGDPMKKDEFPDDLLHLIYNAKNI